jgi:VanZ family protein
VRWQRVALPVYWIVLAAATHYPSVPVPHRVEHTDKVIHFGAFAVLATLFWWFVEARRAPTASTAWLAAAVLIPYAAIDEYTQQCFGRHADVADFIANAAGIATALAVLEIRRRFTQTPTGSTGA